VGGGGWVNGEGFGIADIGEVGEEAEGIDELRSCFSASFDAKDDHGSAFAAEIFFIFSKFGVVWEAREADPLDFGVRLEVFGDGEGVFTVFLHSQRKSFDPLKEEPGIIWCDAGTKISEWNGAHAQDVGEGREHVREVVPPAESVVGGVRLVKEGVFSGGPIEASGVHHHAADTCAMSAKPFGHGMNDNVGTVFEGTSEIGGREGGVDDEWNAVSFGDIADGVEVGDFESRIGDCFAEKSAGFVIDLFGEIFWILRVDEADFDAHGREEIIELRVAASIEISGGDDVISRRRDVDDGVENGGGAGRVPKASHFVSSFEQGDTLFQHVGGGIHQAGVDVSQFFECEEISGVLGVIENERRSAINGDSP